MKKFIAIVLVCLMACAMIPMMASAADNYTYKIENNVLTVTGTGAVVEEAVFSNGVASKDDYPWAAQRATITEVIVGDGITEIGKNAFTQMKALTKITFGKDVTKLGADVMSYCDELTDVIFKGPVAEMGQGCTWSSNKVANVTITGQSVEEFQAVTAVNPYNTKLADAKITVVDAPTGPAKLTLAPKYGKIENWGTPMKTFFIIGGISKEVLTKMGDGTYVVKAVITDETAEKTYTISNYDFEGTGTQEANVGNSLFRLAACDYGVVPEKDHAYTIAVEIADQDGNVLFVGTSAEGAFADSTQTGDTCFNNNGAIIPETVKHYYDEYQAPVVTGDATVIIAALAIVALFGTAVVVKKVHD